MSFCWYFLFAFWSGEIYSAIRAKFDEKNVDFRIKALVFVGVYTVSLIIAWSLYNILGVK